MAAGFNANIFNSTAVCLALQHVTAHICANYQPWKWNVAFIVKEVDMGTKIEGAVFFLCSVRMKSKALKKVNRIEIVVVRLNFPLSSATSPT